MNTFEPNNIRRIQPWPTTQGKYHRRLGVKTLNRSRNDRPSSSGQPKTVSETRELGYALRAFYRSQDPNVPPASETSVKKDITSEQFANFLAWLSADTDRAGEEYERLRFRLSTFFAQRQCRFADELADETINRVITKCSEESIDNKLAYCYGVARNVFRESLRQERPHLDIDDVVVAAKAPEEPTLSRECLDRCLAELPAESRNLILDYFSEAKMAKIELHRRIADSFAMTQTALRMRVMRIKQKLKVCTEECMG